MLKHLPLKNISVEILEKNIKDVIENTLEECNNSLSHADIIGVLEFIKLQYFLWIHFEDE